MEFIEKCKCGRIYLLRRVMEAMKTAQWVNCECGEHLAGTVNGYAGKTLEMTLNPDRLDEPREAA